MNNIDLKLNNIFYQSGENVSREEAAGAIERICRNVNWSFNDYKLSMKRFMENPSLSLFAKNNEDCAGYVIMKPLSKKVGYISFIAVDPDFQRKGIGRELLMKIIDVAVENKIISVELSHDDTEELNLFYASLPFRSNSKFLMNVYPGQPQKKVVYDLSDLSPN